MQTSDLCMYMLVFVTVLTCVSFSSQATGPFLQLGVVGALTLLSPFVFKGFHVAKDKSKFLM